MKCDKCYGSGKVVYKDTAIDYEIRQCMIDCDKCNGTGEDMTEYTIDDLMKDNKNTPKVNFPLYGIDFAPEALSLLVSKIIELTNKNIELEERVKDLEK